VFCLIEKNLKAKDLPLMDANNANVWVCAPAAHYIHHFLFFFASISGKSFAL